ncbi:MAG: hypothetical protein KC503_15560 [Myxococcales bacterium]|nr:hypothetical protein [Myxococcales bacterium]
MIVSLLAATSARAGNEDGVLLGDDAALGAGAVTATVRGGSALMYNPAGLGFLGQARFDASGSAFGLRLTTLPRALRSPDYVSADASQLEFLAVPAALTISMRLAPGLNAAVGVFVSQFVDSELTLELEASDGTRRTRWALGIRDVSQRYHFAGGLGWWVSEHVSVGASLAVIYERSNQSVLLSGVERLGDVVEHISYSSQTSLRSFGFEARVGINLRFERLALGISLRSPSLFLLNRLSSLTTVASALDGMVDADARSETSDSLGVEVLGQSRLRFGAALKLGRWLLSLDGDVLFELTNSEAKHFAKTQGNVRFGARFAISPRWTVGGGFFTDRSAQRETSPDFYGGVLAARYTNRRRLGPREPQDDIYFSTTLGVRYAYGRGDSPGFAVATDITPENNFTVASNDVLVVHELSLYLGSTLHF